MERAGPVKVESSPKAVLRSLSADAISLTGGFWGRRQKHNANIGLRHGWRMLNQAGNLFNLELAAGIKQGEYRSAPGQPYQDSDLYKWLEAASFELGRGDDDELRLWVEQTIALIESAQEESGYLNSYFQVVQPQRKFADLAYGHELYCAGHLFHAAVAHHRATGEERLLNVARRLADHLDAVFGPGKRTGTPGHPEIEMALIELFRETREQRYLNLACFFLDQRGHGLLGPGQHHGGAYFSDHVPVREARTIEGHAVRALYLAGGVTDAYLETGDSELLSAVLRQWIDMTGRKLFITGGLGSQHDGEAFGEPYELPNERCYCETCAQIASVMWNWRLLLATGEARFADLMERTLFNAFLSGIALDGQHYFYVNPLLSYGTCPVLGRKLVERQEWFSCACCPPNIMRLFASLEHYFATRNDRGLQIHQYGNFEIQRASVPGGEISLRMQTEFPWNGEIVLEITETTSARWQLDLRCPAWCDDYQVRVNGRILDHAEQRNGYIPIEREWQQGDRIELTLAMEPQKIMAHPRIDATRGCTAIQRGPVIYCLEQCDQVHDVDILDVSIDSDAEMKSDWRPDLLQGVMTVKAHGYANEVEGWGTSLYAPSSRNKTCSGRPVNLTAIPYFAWANRGPSAMRVWIPLK